MHWEWKCMEINFVYGKAMNSGKSYFSCGARKLPEMCAQTIPHPLFSLPHATGDIYGVFFTFSFIFLHFSMAGNPFLCCTVDGKKRFAIWGFIEVVFAPVRPINVF